MIIAVFSMGQFVSSNLDTLKSGFEKWFSEHGKADVTGQIVWDWMLKNLAALRLNDIRIEEFCELFNKHFEISMSFETFENIFNSMCKLDETSLTRIAAFNDYLKTREEVRFILVSHTNVSHLSYIFEQLNAVLTDYEYAVIHDGTIGIPTAKILFAPSVNSKAVEHSDTLAYALGHLDIDEDDHVISFLNTVKTFDLPKFNYIDAGKSLQIEAIIEAINNISTPSAGMSMR